LAYDFVICSVIIYHLHGGSTLLYIFFYHFKNINDIMMV